MAEHNRQCHPLLNLPELFRVSDTEKDTIQIYASKCCSPSFGVSKIVSQRQAVVEI